MTTDLQVPKHVPGSTPHQKACHPQFNSWIFLLPVLHVKRLGLGWNLGKFGRRFRRDFEESKFAFRSFRDEASELKLLRLSIKCTSSSRKGVPNSTPLAKYAYSYMRKSMWLKYFSVCLHGLNFWCLFQGLLHLAKFLAASASCGHWFGTHRKLSGWRSLQPQAALFWTARRKKDVAQHA